MKYLGRGRERQIKEKISEWDEGKEKDLFLTIYIGCNEYCLGFGGGVFFRFSMLWFCRNILVFSHFSPSSFHPLPCGHSTGPKRHAALLKTKNVFAIKYNV